MYFYSIIRCTFFYFKYFFVYKYSLSFKKFINLGQYIFEVFPKEELLLYYNFPNNYCIFVILLYKNNIKFFFLNIKTSNYHNIRKTFKNLDIYFSYY